MATATSPSTHSVSHATPRRTGPTVSIGRLDYLSVAGNRATIQRQLSYYDDLTAAVRTAIADGLTEDHAAASIRPDAYSSWDRYDEWFPSNVRGIYRWVAGGSM